MKKYIYRSLALLIILSTFLFSFVSCKEKIVDPALVLDGSGRPFETAAKVTYGDMEIDMRIVKQSSDLYEMEVLSPETVAGMSFVYDGGNMKVKYKGMAFTIDPEKFPANMMVDAIVKSLGSAFNAEEVNVTQDGERYTVEGKNDNGPFIMEIDAENGNILSIEIPGEKFSADFGGFMFLPETVADSVTENDT